MQCQMPCNRGQERVRVHEIQHPVSCLQQTSNRILEAMTNIKKESHILSNIVNKLSKKSIQYMHNIHVTESCTLPRQYLHQNLHNWPVCNTSTK